MYAVAGELMGYFNLKQYLGEEGKIEDGSYEDDSVVRYERTRTTPWSGTNGRVKMRVMYQCMRATALSCTSAQERTHRAIELSKM